MANAQSEISEGSLLFVKGKIHLCCIPPVIREDAWVVTRDKVNTICYVRSPSNPCYMLVPEIRENSLSFAEY